MSKSLRFPLRQGIVFVVIALVLVTAWLRFGSGLLFSDGFLPHGHCYLWEPGLVWLHVISDFLIGIAYVAISVGLGYFVYKKQNLPFSGMFVAFGVFIIACGGTHFMEVLTLWKPVYWLSGSVKLLTAMASVATAALLPPLIPKALSLPSPGDLAKANEELSDEVAQRAKTEERLQEANQVLKAVIQCSPVAIVTLDLEGNVTLWNAAAERIFGWTEEEVIGKRNPLVPPGYEKEFQNIVSRVLQGQTVDNVETRRLRKDGALIDTSVSAAPLFGARGNIVGATAALADISERKRSEEEIRALTTELEQHAAQLESTNRELESFSYSVSHDLRAPLRAIDGFAHALVEDCSEKLDESANHYLKKIRTAITQMAALIDALLALSRVTRSELRSEPVNLSELSQRVAGEIQLREPNRCAEFVIEEGLVVTGDPLLLRVVIENLLNNAWKFTSKHPSARIEVSALREPKRTVYFVRDDGAGFDMAYSGNLFGPFQRLHHRSEFEGTGVGLATVQRIIHRHGGKVWAEGIVEKGATFYFTLQR